MTPSLSSKVDGMNIERILARERALGGPLTEALDQAMLGELGVEEDFTKLPRPLSPVRLVFQLSICREARPPGATLYSRGTFRRAFWSKG